MQRKRISKIVLFVGFTPPPRPIDREARIPEQVLSWSSSDIPKVISQNLGESIRHVYVDRILGDIVIVALHRLFGALRVVPVRGVGDLVVQLGRFHPLLAEPVKGALTPAVDFVTTNPDALRIIGNPMAIGSGCNKWQTRWGR